MTTDERATAMDHVRVAARLIRLRAERAIGDGCRDLWAAGPMLDPENNGWYVAEQRQAEVDWDTTIARLPYDYDGYVACHLAPWHPVVALAIADWLEAQARLWANGTGLLDKSALAVARAYLGGAGGGA